MDAPDDINAAGIDVEDEIVASLPIHYSEALSPNLHVHQYQLLTRALEVPPSAAQAGKIIRARYKPAVGRYEIHVPNDVRPEVWNASAGQRYGSARYEEDKEEAAAHDVKHKEKEAQDIRLNDTRLSSQAAEHKGDYVLGVVRDGKLHLHPISQTHLFGPTLSYLDQIAKSIRPSRRAGGDSDDDSDDGPPPDPDDAAAVAAAAAAQAKKKAASKSIKGGSAKEITVAARRTGEDADLGGLSSIRRELIMKNRKEREEPWQDLDYHDADTFEAEEAFEKLFSTSDDVLTSTMQIDAFLKAADPFKATTSSTSTV